MLYLVGMPPTEITLRQIFKTWWPLAASWLIMGVELPFITAVVARMADPKISLAAFGGVIYPLALIIEAPIIMLLAASTALSKDWDFYQMIRRFMMVTSAILTAIHLLVALTPLYYVVVGDWMGVPQLIIEPARIGLIIMTPWTWAIAYRRFNQGVLIRFGHSETVGIGTLSPPVGGHVGLTGGVPHRQHSWDRCRHQRHGCRGAERGSLLRHCRPTGGAQAAPSFSAFSPTAYLASLF